MMIITKRDEYLDLARELKKLRKMRVTEIPIVMARLERSPKAWKGCLPNYSMVKIGLNTQKSHGEMRRHRQIEERSIKQIYSI